VIIGEQVLKVVLEHGSIDAVIPLMKNNVWEIVFGPLDCYRCLTHRNFTIKQLISYGWCSVYFLINSDITFKTLRYSHFPPSIDLSFSYLWCLSLATLRFDPWHRLYLRRIEVSINRESIWYQESKERKYNSDRLWYKRKPIRMAPELIFHEILVNGQSL
jgi:hypothetical protein